MDKTYIVMLTNEQRAELEAYRTAEDPKERLDHLKQIRDLEDLNRILKEEREPWWKPVLPIVVSGAISTGQILLIMKGDRIGEYFNGKFSPWLSKPRK